MSSIELKDFDKLPDAAHVDVNTVAALFGCAVPTVYLRIRRKILPAPRKFGSHARWNVGELRKLLQGEPA